MMYSRLLGGEYATLGDFVYDAELMFENALGFNEPGGVVQVDPGWCKLTQGGAS